MNSDHSLIHLTLNDGIQKDQILALVNKLTLIKHSEEPGISQDIQQAKRE